MWSVGVREGPPPLWSRLGILIQSWSPRPDLLQSHKYKHKCNNKYKHKCNNKYKLIFKGECKSLHKQRRPWPEPASTKNKTDHFFEFVPACDKISDNWCSHIYYSLDLFLVLVLLWYVSRLVRPRFHSFFWPVVDVICFPQKELSWLLRHFFRFLSLVMIKYRDAEICR